MDKKIRNITHIGLMTAIVALISIWQIPLPLLGVGLTLQTFAVALSGYTLGRWRGVLSVLLYIAIGAVGVPVFSGFQGGAAVLFGPSGGFIFGFIPLAAVCAYTFEKKALPSVLFASLGALLCHALGVFQYSLITGTHPLSTLFLVSLPYLLKDILSIVLAYFIARRLRKAVNK